MTTDSQFYEVKKIAEENKVKDILITWLLGFLGIHRFMKGFNLSGVVYLCTVGLFGIGVLVDLIYVIMDKPLMWQK